MHRFQKRMPSRLPLLLLTAVIDTTISIAAAAEPSSVPLPEPAPGGWEILACATMEKIAVTPGDPLECEAGDQQRFKATLAGLYTEGWRLIEVAFFENSREVLYLERPRR